MQIQTKFTKLNQESVVKYLNELSRDKNTIPLTPTMEYDLFVEYKKTNSQLIKERIIKANLRWVITIAKQYTYTKITFEDIINEGNIGLINAIDKFDTTRGIRFVTFATWYIRKYINIFINQINDVTVPFNIQFSIIKILTSIENELAKNNDNICIEDILEIYNDNKQPQQPYLTIADYIEIMNSNKETISISNPQFNDENDDITIADMLVSDTQYNTDNLLLKKESKIQLFNSLESILNERELTIIENYYGLNNKEQKTLDQIAEQLLLTRERVGQLLQNSLKKIKLNKNKLVLF